MKMHACFFSGIYIIRAHAHMNTLHMVTFILNILYKISSNNNIILDKYTMRHIIEYGKIYGRDKTNKKDSNQK